jgi:D-sedoheptulose 7-phosphate isomerase
MGQEARWFFVVIDSEKLERYIDEGIESRRSIDPKEIIKVSKILMDRIKKDGKLVTFGNGGSAADAQHFAAELSGKFMKERRPFPAVALSTNTSTITAIGNDYDFSEIFSRQVEAMCSKNDFVVGISTSGNSQNVLKGLKMAKELGAFTLAMTGKDGGKVKSLVDYCIKVNSTMTPIIQEVHISIIHMICYCIDEML